MVFHLVHNSLGVLVARAPGWLASKWPSFSALVRPADHGGVAFAWPVVLAGGLAGLLIVAWLARLSEKRPNDKRRPATLAEGLPVDA
jgi:hypothetical protein